MYLYQFACATDAQEVRNQEILDMCHHEVIHRGAQVRIPLLGQRGVALLDLVAIAWHVVVVQHGVEQLALVVLYQYTEQIAVANVARRQTVAVGFDVLNQILKHSLIVAFWYYLQIKRQCQ